MTYDFVLMNPPYNLGGKITNESKKHADKTVCLMPLSCYKKKSDELWRYVVSMDLADPKMFVDANITDNLCICTLRGSVVDKFESYDEMSMESYDPKFKAFYEVNSKMPLHYCISERRNAKAEDFDIDTDYVDSNRLVGSDNGFMDGGTSQGYIWNVLRRCEVLNSGLSVITGFVKDGKDNFTKWAYSDCKKGLANKLLWGLGKQTVSSSCSLAIPQIDWEGISEHPLWKEGKYDEAVLDVMGLKWDGEKDGVVVGTSMSLLSTK